MQDALDAHDGLLVGLFAARGTALAAATATAASRFRNAFAGGGALGLGRGWIGLEDGWLAFDVGLRLVLFDEPAYINAVIPSPDCLSASTRNRAKIMAAWQEFIGKCGKPSETWQSLGAVFFVRGVGFWSQKRPLRGAAPNGAELQPVTGLRLVAGC